MNGKVLCPVILDEEGAIPRGLRQEAAFVFIPASLSFAICMTPNERAEWGHA